MQTSQPLHVCFIPCEGVLNFRMAGELAYGLFPCCLGNRVAGWSQDVHFGRLVSFEPHGVGGGCQCVWSVT